MKFKLIPGVGHEQVAADPYLSWTLHYQRSNDEQDSDIFDGPWGYIGEFKSKELAKQAAELFILAKATQREYFEL